MVYILAIIFAVGFGWLLSFLWADYLVFALDGPLGMMIFDHPAAADIAASSHILVSVLVALIAVAPAAKASDVKGALLSGAALGIGIGSVLTGLNWLADQALDFQSVAYALPGAVVLTTLLSGMTFGVTDLLLGELPEWAKTGLRSEHQEIADLPLANAGRTQVVALPFHDTLEKPLPVSTVPKAA